MRQSRLAVVFSVLGLWMPASAAYAVTYNLFIIAGQSNAVGFDTNVAQLPADSADSHIPFFFDTGDPPYDGHDSSSGGVWTTLGAQPKGSPILPYNASTRQYGNFANAAGGFGPEMSFARTLYHAGIADVAIFKFAYNGASFSAGDWNKGDALYNSMAARFQTAKTALEDGGMNTVNLKALCGSKGRMTTPTSAISIGPPVLHRQYQSRL